MDGATEFSGTSVDNCKISFEMDMQNGARVAVYGDAPTNCTFENCKIYGYTNHATLNHYSFRLMNGSKDNKIIYNHLTGYDTPTQRGLMISLEGIGTGFGGFFPLGVTVRPTTPAERNLIQGNNVLEGSYEINMLSGV